MKDLTGIGRSVIELDAAMLGGFCVVSGVVVVVGKDFFNASLSLVFEFVDPVVTVEITSINMLIKALCQETSTFREWKNIPGIRRQGIRRY